MSNSVEAISAKYLAAKKLSGGTRKEYTSTVTKWTAWGNGVDIDQIGRSNIRDFLDCFHDQAAENGGFNPGRTVNKARENLRAIMSRAWEHNYVAKLPDLVRHVTWRPEPLNGQGHESRYGWTHYRRVKTRKQFHRPMIAWFTRT